MGKLTVDDRFRQMWADGVPSKDIAAFYGVKYPSVNTAAIKAGLQSRSNRLGGGKAQSRSDDRILLRMIKQRCKGKSAADIDKKRPAWVLSVTNAVRADDFRQSGEPEGAMRECYW
jgi:hypothetical protein